MAPTRVDDTPTPTPVPPPTVSPPAGMRWELLTPNGEGAVSWYDYPVVNNPDVKNPADLSLGNSPHDQAYYQGQGSVLLNGQVWNYWLSEGKWKRNTWAASACRPPFGSGTQCVVPLQFSSAENPVTGAVMKGGRIPIGHAQLVFIRVPNDKYDLYSDGLVVNTRDECPACGPTQVDVLSFNGNALPNYNSKGGAPAKVYIWAAVQY